MALNFLLLPTNIALILGLYLHLLGNLGFSLEDRYLKRAGLDYWPQVDLVVHGSWGEAAAALAAGSPLPLGSV